MTILDSDYYSISDRAHFLFGLILIILSDYFQGIQAVCITFIVVLALAFFKEFYWDVKYETDEVAGGSIGKYRDWLGYAAGCGSGTAIVFIHFYLHNKG